MKIVLPEKWRVSPCVRTAPGSMHILVFFGSLCTSVSMCGSVETEIRKFCAF